MYKFDQVMLLDGQDRPLRLCGKLEAHRRGLRHRAFSIFLFDSGGNMLLQQRAHTKYHSGGLWSNACCSHPTRQLLLAEAEARLIQELGVSASLRELFTFRYAAAFPNRIVENEVDTVLAGRCDGALRPDPAEVAAVRWVAPEALLRELAQNPERFTVWFRLTAERVLACWGEDGMERGEM